MWQYLACNICYLIFPEFYGTYILMPLESIWLPFGWDPVLLSMILIFTPHISISLFLVAHEYSATINKLKLIWIA